jgi:tagatose-1,6-bisphosphate aldolase non-catalytic subunit AgaZ/GatZ
MTPLKDGPALTELVREAMRRFDALSPKEKRAHRDAQKRSWVIGEMMLAHPEMAREYAEKIYDERTGY